MAKATQATTIAGSVARQTRRHNGRSAYLAGDAAEQRVEQDYERRGYALARRRWRGSTGEIDLILHNGDGLIFVEVKKSRSFARAAERLTRPQMRRIYASAEEYLGQMSNGALTDVRFDVVLVNERGETQVIENAFDGC